MDLKKAFDTVNHEILLQKLELYGIHNKEMKWFCSYLTKRQQCRKVNGKISNIESRICGVPQGSCLGPLLLPHTEWGIFSSPCVCMEILASDVKSSKTFVAEQVF